DDTEVIRGVASYYYVVAVGNSADNTGGGLTPPGLALVSSRYYSQTYDAAFLKRQAGLYPLDGIRVVPNPYIISSNEKTLRFEGQTESNKIKFYEIPGECTIRIYTELGEKIKEIVHTDGSADAEWNSTTSSNQIVVSGVYIVHFTVDEDQLDPSGNVLYRKGETAFRKFVVIR
ncbi:MAG TPA: fibronectin, partial [Bacteroidota bacterium]